MSELTFMSHVARGLGAGAPAAEADGLTTSVTLTVVAQPSGTEHVITKRIGLYRPCDVVGIASGAIFRTDPDHRTIADDFEPNYLAAVEFAAADLPWRFSSQAPVNGRHMPWLALVVLAEGEFDHVRRAGPDTGGSSAPRPATIRIHQPATVLPPSDQLGAWAHAQAIGPVAGASALELEQLDGSSLAALRSRVIAARRLQSRTRYTACLVPTFECGRTRGLDPNGEHEHAPGPSWSTATTTPREFPIYFSWQFATSSVGDIEALAERIAPRPVGPLTGTTPLIVGPQEYSVPATPEPQQYAGALVSSQRPDPPSQPAVTTDAIVRVLNAPGVLRDDIDDPMIGLAALAPPMYGQWHAEQHRIDRADTDESWVSTLNSNVAHRSAAGLGAEVVRRHQDELVAEAWRQVGDVLGANRKLCSAQMGLLTSTSLYRRTFQALGDDRVLMIARPVLAKLRPIGTATVESDLERSSLQGIISSARMRATLAPRGVSRRAFKAAAVNIDPTKTITTLAQSTELKHDFEQDIVDPAMQLFIDTDDVAPTLDARPTVDLTELTGEVKVKLSPATTIPSRINELIDGIQISTVPELCNAVMPAPEFDTPMYAPLRDIAVEYLLPGIGDIESNSAALLESNPRFIEAFMSGLNHEMAAELLWRGYPATDLRATYFRYFWESAGEFPDVDELHRWKTALGENSTLRESLVLLIRGDIVRRYPGIMIYAQQAELGPDDAFRLGERVSEPIFRGDLTPDTLVVGFDLDEAQARGFVPTAGRSISDERAEVVSDPGFFFVLEEQPRETRFGLDEPGAARTLASGDGWQAVDWADVAPRSHTGPGPWHGPIDLAMPTRQSTLPSQPPWNGTAADTAVAFFQQPYRIAIHGQRLLPKPGSEGGPDE